MYSSQGFKVGEAAQTWQRSRTPFPLLKRGEKTPEVLDAKLAFQRQ